MSRGHCYVDDHTALLSLHDVTPFFEDDVVTTIDRLSDIGISGLTLLVTPFYHLKKTNVFERGSMFSEYLLSLDLEIALHGYSHITKSGSASEFARLTTEQATRRMKKSLTMFLRAFDRKPTGFVPPLWSAPPRVDRVARSLGFKYTVREDSVKPLTDSRPCYVAASILSQGTRTIETADAMLEIELGGPLQIGVHPLDHSMNNMINFLTELKDSLGYRFMGYADFISEMS
ncbi:MAG: DUF2334 domain-containing protein [Candidatus Thorarchaeota archaeon]